MADIFHITENSSEHIGIISALLISGLTSAIDGNGNKTAIACDSMDNITTKSTEHGNSTAVRVEIKIPNEDGNIAIINVK